MNLFPKDINSSFKDKNYWQLHMLYCSKLIPWQIYLSREVAKTSKLLLKDKSTPILVKHFIFWDSFCAPLSKNPRNMSACAFARAQGISLVQFPSQRQGSLKLNIHFPSLTTIFSSYLYYMERQQTAETWCTLVTIIYLYFCCSVLHCVCDFSEMYGTTPGRKA